MLEERLVYWIWLTQRKGFGARRVNQLLEYFHDPAAVYRASGQQLQQVLQCSASGVEPLMDRNLSKAEEILRLCQYKHIRILTCQDPEYPQRLRNIFDPPAVLYYRGYVPKIDEQPLITMVGTRKASVYGIRQAGRFAMELTHMGCTVVSGGAKGIDTEALRMSLMAGGSPVCVLGCGVDVVYPACNAELFEDIAGIGWLVSEYPPGAEPLPSHFPPRNRILSGLSVGTLVVEAGSRSGALITAHHALDQGRDVFAIPGDVQQNTNSGSNSLIKEGAALVQNAWDIAQEYQYRFPNVIRKGRWAGVTMDEQCARLQSRKPASPLCLSVPDPSEKTQKKSTPIPAGEKKRLDNPAPAPYHEHIAPSLNETERAILQALRDGADLIDDIVVRSGLTASQVSAALTMLQIKKLVQQMPGKRFVPVK